jgi:hypothetical protein
MNVGVKVYLHTFLTSSLDGGEWSVSRPGRFTPGETATRYSLGRSQSRYGRNGEEKNSRLLPEIEPQ